MIRNLKIIFTNDSVWSKGSVYDSSSLVPYKSTNEYRQSGIYVVFDKNYPKGTPTIKIWQELREKMTAEFFNIFYPSVVEQTSFYVTEPDFAKGNYRQIRGEDGKLGFITKQLYEKQSKYPEKYGWSKVFNKFVMKPDAYIDSVEDINISVTDEGGHGMFGTDMLDRLQEQNHGKTIKIWLFVYPDRYDEVFRGIFEVIITFWG